MTPTAPTRSKRHDCYGYVSPEWARKWRPRPNSYS
jgi:hypothetical protein